MFINYTDFKDSLEDLVLVHKVFFIGMELL
jgi:hypothetical protein